MAQIRVVVRKSTGRNNACKYFIHSKPSLQGTAIIKSGFLFTERRAATNCAATLHVLGWSQTASTTLNLCCARHQQPNSILTPTHGLSGTPDSCPRKERVQAHRRQGLWTFLIEVTVPPAPTSILLLQPPADIRSPGKDSQAWLLKVSTKEHCVIIGSFRLASF